MHHKVAELANRYRVSKDAVYAWIRQGLIPEECLVRLGNSIRVHNNTFEKLMREGKLQRPRRTVRRVEIAEDQVTICATADAYGHRWTDENSRVTEHHPYGRQAVAPK